MMRPNGLVVVTACGVLLSAVSAAHAAGASGEASDASVGFQLLVRGVYLQPTGSTNDFPIHGGGYPDFSAIQPIDLRWSAELTVGAQTDVGGAQPQGDFGQNQRFSFMVHTLTGRYSPYTEGRLWPYVGLGIAYATVHYSYNNTQGAAPRFDGSSLSAVLQGGLDWRLTAHFFINADLRFLPNFNVDYTTPYDDPTNHGSLHVMPVLFGLGIGVQF